MTDEEKRLRTRNLQLLAALGSVRDLAATRPKDNRLWQILEQIEAICDEQAKMGWADESADPNRLSVIDYIDSQRWRDLVRSLIANDARCQSPFCATTMLGHLLDGCTPEEVEMVRSVDPTDGVVRG